MKNTIWILSSLISFSLFSQSKSEIKQIEKVLGKEFTKAESEDYYHKCYPKIVNADTSLVMKYDTTGIHINGEYLMFRNPLTYDKRKEAFKFIKQSPVTVKDYNKFIFWVRDSIAREKLFYGLEDDVLAHSFLVEHKANCSDQCLASREQAREKYPLNWEIIIDYNNPDYIPILEDMYIPQVERFYDQHEFDTRKLIYTYQETFNEYPEAFISNLRNNSNINIRQYGYFNLITQKDDFPRINVNKIAITPNYPILASNDYFLYTEASVISEVFEKQFNESPLYGLLGTQASAYCFWLEKNINSELTNSGLDLKVKVTLPSANDVSSENSNKIEIPAYNYTNTWIITSKEYQDFINQVRDSLIQEKLYYSIKPYEEANELIQHMPIYFDESSLEWAEFDPSDRYTNRGLFSLNKINLKEFCEGKWIDTVTLEENTTIGGQNRISLYDFHLKAITEKGIWYRYWLEDIAAQGFPGFFIYDEDQGRYILDVKDEKNTYERLKYNENRQGYEDYPSFKGQDLCIGGDFNGLGSYLNVRGHSDLSSFRIENLTLINKDNSNKFISNGLMEDLTYEQAIAFYTWKYPRWKMKTTHENWQKFVFPTEEQFKKIQKGEKVIIPAHSIEYPTPLFRYVVHFYDK